MPENLPDAPEFTAEQLRDALRRVGQDARRAAFAAGRPVFVVKGTMIVALHPDGTEEVVESLRPELETASDPQ
jgi:hypothetical protein